VTIWIASKFGVEQMVWRSLGCCVSSGKILVNTLPKTLGWACWKKRWRAVIDMVVNLRSDFGAKQILVHEAGIDSFVA